MSLNLPALLLLLYFAAILVITQLFSRRIRNLGDFFLAGKRLGSWPAAFALAAAWFGASSTMGSINAFHEKGLSGMWQLVLPSILSFIVITFVMAKPVARQRFLSQPEAVEAHYGRFGRLLMSIVILTATVAFIASQMVAAAQVYKAVFGLNMAISTVLSTVTVLSYSAWGGYFAVVVTDVAQIIFVVTGFLILLFFTAGQAVPDAHAWQAFLTQQQPNFWNWSHHWQENIFLVLTFVLGWSIAPEMWQRMSSTGNADVAFRASWQAIIIMVCLFSVIVAIGLLSTQVVGSDKAVMIALAMRIPSDILRAFVLLGFVSAVTSTMDSSINIASLTLTRDIYQRFINSQGTDRHYIWAARLATLLMMLPAMTVALYYQDIIHILWISADIFACCMFWPVLGMLYVKQPGRLSGILGIFSGGIGVCLGLIQQAHTIPLPFPWPDGPASSLLGVMMSGLGYLLGYWLDSIRRKPLPSPYPLSTMSESHS